MQLVTSADLGNTSVVLKSFEGGVRSMTHRSTEGETRRLIMLTMLRAGTITATQLAHTLGLSAAGIRRHLDALIDDE